MPDLHGSVKGKALRPDAFEAAIANGTVMTDLLLALDPVDTPITDYERFGIRSGAGMTWSSTLIRARSVSSRG